ncbi:MAG: hypothetical protein ACI8Q1_000370 [Parvicella sp.]|jgi:hypothetical protein
MENLLDDIKTESTIEKDVFIQFSDDLNRIKYHISISGKEKVFLNDNLMYEQRNLKKNSKFIINDNNGTEYTLEFLTISLMKMIYQCIIAKNDIIVKKYNIIYKRERIFTLNSLIVLTIVTVLSSITTVILKLPLLLSYILPAVIMVYNIVYRKKSGFIISEDYLLD